MTALKHFFHRALALVLAGQLSGLGVPQWVHAEPTIYDRLVARGVPFSLASHINNLMQRMRQEIDAATTVDAKNAAFQKYMNILEAGVQTLLDENSSWSRTRAQAPRSESVMERNVRLVMGFDAFQKAQQTGDPRAMADAMVAINGGLGAVIQLPQDVDFDLVDMNLFREHVRQEAAAAIVQEISTALSEIREAAKLDPTLFGIHSRLLEHVVVEGFGKFPTLSTVEEIRPGEPPREIVGPAASAVDPDIVVVEPLTVEPSRTQRVAPVETVVQTGPANERIIVKVIKIFWGNRQAGQLGLVDRVTIFVGKRAGAIQKAFEVYAAKFRERSRIRRERSVLDRADREIEREHARAERERARAERNAQREREELARQAAQAEKERAGNRVVYEFRDYGERGQPGSSVAAWAVGLLGVAGYTALGALGGTAGYLVGGVLSFGLTESYTVMEWTARAGFFLPLAAGFIKGVSVCSEILSQHSRDLDDWNRRGGGW